MKTQSTEAESKNIPVFLDQKSSEQLLESLKELRLKYWSEVMIKDLAEMTPAGQELILKSLSR